MDFIADGTPSPFEDTSRYTARRVRDRFTQQILIDYTAELGLRPLEPGLYAPDRTAVMVEHTDPPAPNQLRPTSQEPDPARSTATSVARDTLNRPPIRT